MISFPPSPETMSLPAPEQMTSFPGVPVIRSAEAVPEILQSGSVAAELTLGKLDINSETRAAANKLLRNIPSLHFLGFQ